MQQIKLFQEVQINNWNKHKENIPNKYMSLFKKIMLFGGVFVLTTSCISGYVFITYFLKFQ